MLFFFPSDNTLLTASAAHIYLNLKTNMSCNVTIFFRRNISCAVAISEILCVGAVVMYMVLRISVVALSGVLHVGQWG